MAFTSTTLARLGHANGITFWIYKTADAPAVIDTVDYFLAAIKSINVGDLIYTLASGGTAFGFFVCNANDGTVIDVADMLDAAAADTD